MSANVKAIVFDIGGVVIHDRGLKAKVQCAFPHVSSDRLWHLVNVALLPACRGEASRLACWQNVADELGVALPSNALSSLWDTADFVDGIEVDHEVVQLVRSLRRRYKLGVISNTMSEHAIALRSMGIYDEFDDVTLSHEVGLTKDRAGIFEVAVSRLQVEPREAIFIDDIAAYVEVAQSIGMQGILFTNSAALAVSLGSLGIPCD